MKFAAALTLGIAYIVAQQTASVTDSLIIKISPVKDMVRLDEPIELQITFANTGEIPFYVAKTYDIGPHSIEITAHEGACEYTVSATHATLSERAQHFLLIPLSGYDRFTQQLTPINDIEAAGANDLLFPHEGKYSIRATFHSEGDAEVGGRGPVWRGTVTSDPVSLIVRPPNLATMYRMRERLEEGLESGIIDAIDPVAIAYFRYVRDAVSADSLVRLVEAGSVDPLLGEAIAHQGRPGDAQAVERWGRNLSRSSSGVAAYAFELAKKLRASAPCAR